MGGGIPWHSCPPHHLCQRIASWPYSLASIPVSSTHLEGPVQPPLPVGSPPSLSPLSFFGCALHKPAWGDLGNRHYRKILAECVGLKGRPGQRQARLALTASCRAWALGVDPDCHATPRGRAGADVALPAWGTQRRGERMPPHPEPALPGLSRSTLCRPVGCEEPPRLHLLTPSPDGERFQFSPSSGWGPRGQSREGQAIQPGEDEAQLLG